MENWPFSYLAATDAAGKKVNAWNELRLAMEELKTNAYAHDNGNKPLVSIIIPVYKVEAYLKQCLDSVLAQTYTHWEAIVVDDGSPDDCGAMADAYAAEDNRFRVIHQQNGGLSAARNTGLEAAKGEYIAFLDSDDYYEDCYLEKLLEHMDSHTIVCCGFREFQDEGEAYSYDHGVQELMTLGREDFMDFLIEGELKHFEGIRNPLGNYMWNKLYPRTCFAVARFPVGHNMEDMYINLELYAQAETFVIIPDILYHYRQRANSIVRSESRKKHLRETIEGRARQWNLLKAYPRTQIKVKKMLDVVVGKYLYEYLLGRYDLSEEDKNYCRTLVAGIYTSEELQQTCHDYIREQLPKLRARKELLEEQRNTLRTRNQEAKQKLQECKAERQILKEKLQRSKQENVELRAESKQKKQELAKVKSKLQQVQNSTAYKIGRLITWLPRKLMGRK